MSVDVLIQAIAVGCALLENGSNRRSTIIRCSIEFFGFLVPSNELTSLNNSTLPVGSHSATVLFDVL